MIKGKVILGSPSLPDLSCFCNASHCEYLAEWFVCIVLMLLCLRRLWTPHQSCCSVQCLAQLCTQPYLSPTLCKSLATASCRCLPTGPHQTVNITSTQVKKKELLFHFSPADVLFWAFPRVSSAAVCAQSHRRTLLQLQRKHGERFDHGVCRGASTFEGVNKLHSACK